MKLEERAVGDVAGEQGSDPSAWTGQGWEETKLQGNLRQSEEHLNRRVRGQNFTSRTCE